LQEIKEIDQIRELFDTNVYLVGGAVRDIIWGKRINDLDFKVFLPIQKIIEIIEKIGFVKCKDYKTKEGEYYISSFPGVLGLNMGGRDVHLSEAYSPDIKELIKRGDINFNCCSYDIHTRKILNPEYIEEIKAKELKFANSRFAKEDPTIVINALAQISKLPDIIIPEETDCIIKESIPKINKFLKQNPNYKYLFDNICTSLNSEEALAYLGDYREDIVKNTYNKKPKLYVSSETFHSEEIEKLSNLQRKKIFEIVQKAYGKTFDPSKVFNGHSNSVVWQEKNEEIISCGIIDGERLYSAAAKDRLSWIRLVSEITKNNYNLWGTVDYRNTKIRALCSLAGLKLENNPQIIEKILKTKSHKYKELKISNCDGMTIFRKGDVPQEKPQILMRS